MKRLLFSFLLLGSIECLSQNPPPVINPVCNGNCGSKNVCPDYQRGGNGCFGNQSWDGGSRDCKRDRN